MPVTKEIAACDNVVQALEEAARAFSNKTCQFFKDVTKKPGEYKHRRTFREYYSLVQKVAIGLVRDRLEPGAYVCILSENRPEWNVFDHAVLMNHCTTVGIYTNDSREILRYKLNDTRSPVILVEDKKQLDKILCIPAADVPDLKRIYVLDAEGIEVDDARVLKHAELLDEAHHMEGEAWIELERRITAVRSSDVARLVYTSGTSGDPKGVMLTHGNMMSNVVASTQGADLREDDVLITYMPESHIFQAIFSLGILFVGACQAFSYRKTMGVDLGQVRPTVFPGVQRVWAKVHSALEVQMGSGLPRILRAIAPRLLARIIQKKIGIDNVRRFFTGASKLEPYTFEFFKNFFGHEILLGYGISETIIVSVNTVEEHRFGSSGKPVPGTTVRAVDIERNTLPAGEVGELALRGPSVFAGYLNNEEKYKQVVDEEGWYYTGDRGYVDEDGYVFVLGRAGFRVKFSDGEYHDLEAIGARLLGHTKLISQIAVFGEGKDYPVAVVSLTDEEDDLRLIAADLGVPYTNPLEFAYHNKVVEACKKEFAQACVNLREVDHAPAGEVIRKAIYIRPMSEDNSEKTPTAKTRLTHILTKYEDVILNMYDADDTFVVHRVE